MKDKKIKSIDLSKESIFILYDEKILKYSLKYSNYKVAKIKCKDETSNDYIVNIHKLIYDENNIACIQLNSELHYKIDYSSFTNENTISFNDTYTDAEVYNTFHVFKKKLQGINNVPFIKNIFDILNILSLEQKYDERLGYSKKDYVDLEKIYQHRKQIFDYSFFPYQEGGMGVFTFNILHIKRYRLFILLVKNIFIK